MSEAKDAPVFENDTWLYDKDGNGKLFAKGDAVPADGYSEHPPTYEGDPAAAREALIPELDRLKAENEALRSQLAAKPAKG